MADGVLFSMFLLCIVVFFEEWWPCLSIFFSYSFSLFLSLLFFFSSLAHDIYIMSGFGGLAGGAQGVARCLLRYLGQTVFLCSFCSCSFFVYFLPPLSHRLFTSLLSLIIYFSVLYSPFLNQNRIPPPQLCAASCFFFFGGFFSLYISPYSPFSLVSALYT